MKTPITNDARLATTAHWAAVRHRSTTASRAGLAATSLGLAPAGTCAAESIETQSDVRAVSEQSVSRSDDSDVIAAAAAASFHTLEHAATVDRIAVVT